MNTECSGTRSLLIFTHWWPRPALASSFTSSMDPSHPLPQLIGESSFLLASIFDPHQRLGRVTPMIALNHRKLVPPTPWRIPLYLHPVLSERDRREHWSVTVRHDRKLSLLGQYSWYPKTNVLSQSQGRHYGGREVPAVARLVDGRTRWWV